jgi:hypothetical protein
MAQVSTLKYRVIRICGGKLLEIVLGDCQVLSAILCYDTVWGVESREVRWVYLRSLFWC